MFRKISNASWFATLLVSLSCSSGDSESSGGATPASAAPAPGAGPAAGARGAPTVVLAATDVAKVSRSTIEDGLAVTGDLQPIETVLIRARLEGDLVGVYVREGDRVRAGQVLARFENSQQQSGFRSAEAERAEAQSELATAQWNLEQSKELFDAGAIPERDLKVAQQAVASAQSSVAAADARVRSTGSFIQDTRVLATTPGVISQRDIENGEHVARGAPLFTLVRSDVLELEASVPARKAGGVVVGQRVRFTADGRSFEGRVARVSPTIDPSTRSITVFVQIPNVGGSLKGGTFATGRIIGRTMEGALVVPAAAVRQAQDGGRPFVYRIDGQKLSTISVALGVADEQRGIVEVLEGLAEGDLIVVGNVGTLGNGMKVEVIGEGRAANREP